MSRITWTGAAADGDWSNLANWQGGAYPQNGDDVVITGNADPVQDTLGVLAGGLTLNSLDNSASTSSSGFDTGGNQIGLNITISSGGYLVLGDNSNLGYYSYWSGNASLAAISTFNDGSYNFGTTGDANFNDNSTNGYGGSIGGNAIFNDQSHLNYGSVGGDGVFNDMSEMGSGTVIGDATFNDGSILGGGTIEGDATFTGTSQLTQYGHVVGNVSLQDSSNSQGVVEGTVTLVGPGSYFYSSQCPRIVAANPNLPSEGQVVYGASYGYSSDPQTGALGGSAPTADQVLVTGTIYDGQGNQLPNGACEVRLIQTTVIGLIPGAPFIVTADDEGDVSEWMIKNTDYQVSYDGGEWVDFNTGETGCVMPQALGYALQ